MRPVATKTYSQYCGLAKALDHVGGRWTLLIVRELLIGPRRYSQIRAALPGIATNLLSQRLDLLEADGIVTRSPDGAYSLTDLGATLEPVVESLVRFGGRWMTQRESGEIFRPQWLVVALRALLPKRRPGSLELHVDGDVVHVGRTSIDVGPSGHPDAVIEASAEQILGVAAGEIPLDALRIRGDRRVAAAALRRR